MASILVTDDMFSLLTRTIQLGMQAPGRLSNHEAETAYLVMDRCLDLPGATLTTVEEWAVVRAAHDDLVRHFTEDVAA